MKIIYHCFGGSHSSVTAAGIHLELLPFDRLPTSGEIERLPYFDQQLASDHGIIRFIGKDESGNKVYIVGRRNLGAFYEPMMKGVLQILGVDSSNVLFVNTMPCVNFLMKVGGFSSRRLGWVMPGRATVIAGIKLAYPKFIQLVSQVRWGVDFNEGMSKHANNPI